MKPTVRIGISLLSLAGLLTATAAAQTLGEIARQQRAQKPPAPATLKVYTNDNLPTSGTLSEVGPPATSPSPKAIAATEKAEKESAEKQSKLEAEWRAKFAEQKKSIALLERELDVAVRNKNQAWQDHYGRGGGYLVSSQQAAMDIPKYQNEIDQKQKDLADAKQKLEDMQEELRKAGLPNSWAD